VRIVIPVFGKWPVTERCLRALAKTEALSLAEVVVVNDASPDGTLAQVSRFPWVTVKDLPGNVGYTLACNQGAAGADTDYILLLNNDTEPLPGFLDALLEVADADPTIGVVGSRLIYPDGRLQEAGGIVWADASGHNYGRNDSPDRPEYLHVRDVDYCSGASILIRTSFFRDVGGYDSRYSPAYYEDTDLAFAAREQGLRVVYQPASVVIHHEGATSGTSTSSGIKRYQEINKPIFRAKWQHRLQDQPMPNEMPLRIAAARGRRRGLLFIDHAIPTPEHDSGSRRSCEIMRLCQAMGYETVLASASDTFTPAGQALRQQGTMVLRGEGEVSSFLEAEGDWLDCIFVARVGQARRWLPWLVKRYPSLPIVFDTVDLHHVREARGARVTRSRVAALRAKLTEARELGVVRRCAATLAVSEGEREYLQRRLPTAHVYTVGNIHRLSSDVAPYRERGGFLFIGTFLHPPNTDGVVWFLDQVWPRVRPDIREAGLDVIGQDPPPKIRHAAKDGTVTIHGWVRDVEPFLAKARISVAPLRYGAGVKGKVGEAWSHGLPVVGTTIAFEGTVDKASPAWLAADDPSAFAKLLEHVYSSEEVWQAASRAGQEFVARSLSGDLARTRLGEVLADVAKAAPSRDAAIRS